MMRTATALALLLALHSAEGFSSAGMLSSQLGREKRARGCAMRGPVRLANLGLRMAEQGPQGPQDDVHIKDSDFKELFQRVAEAKTNLAEIPILVLDSLLPRQVGLPSKNPRISFCAALISWQGIFDPSHHGGMYAIPSAGGAYLLAARTQTYYWLAPRRCACSSIPMGIFEKTRVLAPCQPVKAFFHPSPPWRGDTACPHRPGAI